MIHQSFFQKSMDKLSDENNPNNCSLYKTPINKRRSLHRQNGDLSGTLNVTNLNLLFDNLETPRSAANVLIKSHRKRNSSTPGKLQLLFLGCLNLKKLVSRTD